MKTDNYFFETASQLDALIALASPTEEERDGIFLDIWQPVKTYHGFRFFEKRVILVYRLHGQTLAELARILNGMLYHIWMLSSQSFRPK